jgi:GNAT superfamily N-acetyltransferase
MGASFPQCKLASAKLENASDLRSLGESPYPTSNMFSIVRITEWPAAAIQPLIAESQRENIRFLTRLGHDWKSRANRFAAEGEAFFGIYEGKTLIAVGGINRESPDCGRLRRFYVRRDRRRTGVGRLLLEHLLGFAATHYARVNLWTDSEAADRFYLAMGFARVDSFAGATHSKLL